MFIWIKMTKMIKKSFGSYLCACKAMLTRLCNLARCFSLISILGSCWKYYNNNHLIFKYKETVRLGKKRNSGCHLFLFSSFFLYNLAKDLVTFNWTAWKTVTLTRLKTFQLQQLKTTKFYATYVFRKEQE